MWGNGCIEPFRMVGSCPHVSVVVVLASPHFPSLRYIYAAWSPNDVLISVWNDRFMASCCNGCGAGLLSFPVSRNVGCLSTSWCPHILVFTTTCCSYYCFTGSCSIFPVENGGSSWNFWELAIGDRGKLGVKDEKENTPLFDMVAIIAKVYSVVCQLHVRLWNTTMAT